MKTKPMLFNADMVRALLEGRKTQTRRIFNKDGKYKLNIVCPPDGGKPKCPYGEVGDLLWVRETFWQKLSFVTNQDGERESHWLNQVSGYSADGYTVNSDTCVCAKRPSIHMPRWASRLTLEITSVRVERLQDISEEDAVAEGVYPNCAMLVHNLCNHTEYLRYPFDPDAEPAYSAKESFQTLWDSVYGNWSENLWVWVIEFKVHRCNVDEFKGVEL